MIFTICPHYLLEFIFTEGNQDDHVFIHCHRLINNLLVCTTQPFYSIFRVTHLRLFIAFPPINTRQPIVLNVLQHQRIRKLHQSSLILDPRLRVFSNDERIFAWTQKELWPCLGVHSSETLFLQPKLKENFTADLWHEEWYFYGSVFSRFLVQENYFHFV